MKNWIVQQIITFAKGSWKTTLTGFIEGMCIAITPILATQRMPRSWEWMIVIIGGWRFVSGCVAKDGDKVGTGAPGDPVRGGTPSEQREAVSKDVQKNVDMTAFGSSTK